MSQGDSALLLAVKCNRNTAATHPVFDAGLPDADMVGVDNISCCDVMARLFYGQPSLNVHTITKLE